jgi:glycerol-3-phosphate cytidylyltransferase
MKYKIGFTCGAFDLCHAGHMLMFEEVKNQCDHLIVGLQNDPSIDRPEKNKPVQSIVERQIQLHAIKYIDDVIVYNTEADLLDLLKTLPISVRFIGEDHKDKDFTGRHLDIHSIVFNSRMHSFSTSDLRSRVIASTIENSKPKSISISDLPLHPSAFYNGLNGITAADLGYTKK